MASMKLACRQRNRHTVLLQRSYVTCKPNCHASTQFLNPQGLFFNAFKKYEIKSEILQGNNYDI